MINGSWNGAGKLRLGPSVGRLARNLQEVGGEVRREVCIGNPFS